MSANAAMVPKNFSFKAKDFRVESIDEAFELLCRSNPWSKAMCKMMHCIVDEIGEREASDLLIKGLRGRKLPKSVFQRFIKSGDVKRIGLQRLPYSVRRRVVSKSGVKRPEGMKSCGAFNPNAPAPVVVNAGVKTNVPGRGPAKGPSGSKSTQTTNSKKAAKLARKQAQRKKR